MKKTHIHVRKNILAVGVFLVLAGLTYGASTLFPSTQAQIAGGAGVCPSASFAQIDSAQAFGYGWATERNEDGLLNGQVQMAKEFAVQRATIELNNNAPALLDTATNTAENSLVCPGGCGNSNSICLPTQVICTYVEARKRNYLDSTIFPDGPRSYGPYWVARAHCYQQFDCEKVCDFLVQNGVAGVPGGGGNGPDLPEIDDSYSYEEYRQDGDMYGGIVPSSDDFLGGAAYDEDSVDNTTEVIIEGNVPSSEDFLQEAAHEEDYLDSDEAFVESGVPTSDDFMGEYDMLQS